MKRCVIFIAILATWLFIGTQIAMALGIDISATVNPNWNNSWDKDTLTGTALYTINVDFGSQHGADLFDVTFEKDVFASIAGGEVLSPSGLLLSSYEPYPPNGNLYEYAYSAIPLNPGESISFLVNYTLLSADRYYQNSGLNWAWDEGGFWEQAVNATYSLEEIEVQINPFKSVWVNPSGGTSTTHAPEPATMLLFGSGLIGLGWFGRKKTRKGSKC